MSSETEHEEILKEIRQVRVDFTRHVEEDHYFMPASQIEKILAGQTDMLHEMREQQELLAEVVLGEKKPTYDGGYIREGGIKGIVDSWNGHGFTFDIPWSKLLVFIGTVITSAAGIIIAVIEAGG